MKETIDRLNELAPILGILLTAIGMAVTAIYTIYSKNKRGGPPEVKPSRRSHRLLLGKTTTVNARGASSWMANSVCKRAKGVHLLYFVCLFSLFLLR